MLEESIFAFYYLYRYIPKRFDTDINCHCECFPNLFGNHSVLNEVSVMVKRASVKISQELYDELQSLNTDPQILTEFKHSTVPTAIETAIRQYIARARSLSIQYSVNQGEGQQVAPTAS